MKPTPKVDLKKTETKPATTDVKGKDPAPKKYDSMAKDCANVSIDGKLHRESNRKRAEKCLTLCPEPANMEVSYGAIAKDKKIIASNKKCGITAKPKTDTKPAENKKTNTKALSTKTTTSAGKTRTKSTKR